jgi:Ni,Fe-hydrogenase III large subunit
MNISFIKTGNGIPVALKDIPVLSYSSFYEEVKTLMSGNEDYHCVNYYAFPFENGLRFLCCIADDHTSLINIYSFFLDGKEPRELESLAKEVYSLHIFERELCENYGINFKGHPWLKPVRYAHNRHDHSKTLRNYPFFKIEGEEIHEVGVGPIHAGVIEPGHFRFSCHGETVHHLEIQLGYQHRGIETLFLTKKKLIQRNVLAESIAGDTVAGHTSAFVQTMEALYGYEASPKLELLRAIALELERICVHTGDLSAMCLDVSYQLGSSVFGALRTPMINFFQFWCGNRFAKGLIRTGYSGYPFTDALQERLLKTLRDFEMKFIEMADETFSLPSVMSRFEKTGETTTQQMRLIGAVGMAARTAGLNRDVRNSHPFAFFKQLKYQPVLLDSGDVYARARLRDLEVRASIAYIRDLLQALPSVAQYPADKRMLFDKRMQPDAFVLSLTEGWRGEVCHAAVTDGSGELLHYKIKDPSLHNWMALALALRENEISDFPINNKSFDLSYCGNDL